jgi:hypothetical protein
MLPTRLCHFATISRFHSTGSNCSRGPFLKTHSAEVKKLKILEEDNRKLKKLVADLSLDKQMLQDVLRRKA